MARDAKTVAEAWGRLAGLAVDACQSHHVAHAAGPTIAGRETEVGTITLTTKQRCQTSWTDHPGQVKVEYDAPAVTPLANPPMQLLPAGSALSTQSNAAVPSPTQAPQGVSEVTVSLAAGVPRGLYVGRLRPVTGGTPDNPVLIYIDDVV